MAAHRFVLCDVFAQRPLEGNALCVFTDARNLDDDRMQQLARETNLSETSFVLPPRDGGTFRVRIFTPSRELPFAGHPLIGTAAVLGRAVPVEGMMLETQVGNLAVALERDDMTVTGAVLEQPPPSFADHPACSSDLMLQRVTLSISTMPPLVPAMPRPLPPLAAGLAKLSCLA